MLSAVWPHLLLESVQVPLSEEGHASAVALTFRSSTVLVRLEFAADPAGSLDCGSKVLVPAADGQPIVQAGEEVEVANGPATTTVESEVAAQCPVQSPDGMALSGGWQLTGSDAADFEDLATVRSEVLSESGDGVKLSYSQDQELQLARSASSCKPATEGSPGPVAMMSLAPGLVLQRAALAAKSAVGAATPQFNLCQAQNQADITTMPEATIERALREDRALPGWDYNGDTLKHGLCEGVFRLQHYDVQTWHHLGQS